MHPAHDLPLADEPCVITFERKYADGWEPLPAYTIHTTKRVLCMASVPPSNWYTLAARPWRHRMLVDGKVWRRT